MHPDCPAANETLPASAISAAIPAASQLIFDPENYFHDRFDHLSSFSMTKTQYRNPNLVPHENYFRAFAVPTAAGPGLPVGPFSENLRPFLKKISLKNLNRGT
jgi:hypothetical protein